MRLYSFSSAPARLMRLHQPVGIWLLLWPCWWSAALHADGFPSLGVLLLFALGAALMRSAGCIVNDLIDRDIDVHVERTRKRPLASGEIGRRKAVQWLAGLLFFSAIIAALLGAKVVLWSMLALPLVAAYPFMKRITWWPQAFLGLTFNWGALLGSVAVTGEVTPASLWLYAGGVFWTLAYDTIYAEQDKRDDARIGVKSTARLFGNKAKRWCAIFYGIMWLCFWMSGLYANAGFFYFAGITLMTFLLLVQLEALNLDSPRACREAFVRHAWLAGWMFAGCLL